MNHPLTIVNPHLAYKKVSLIEPSSSAFLHIAAEIDHHLFPFFWRSSARKKAIISHARQWCQQLEASGAASSAVVFKARLIPPGQGRLLRERNGRAQIARYDLAILIEADTEAQLQRIMQQPAYQELVTMLQEASRLMHKTIATNARRIGPVDHKRQGVFLFNYFYADVLQQNLDIWEYTAGWFEEETGLDNSTLLLPASPDARYTVINHCRWDNMRDILPALLWKRTFKRYVLDNFYANNVAAMPILYVLA